MTTSFCLDRKQKTIRLLENFNLGPCTSFISYQILIYEYQAAILLFHQELIRAQNNAGQTGQLGKSVRL
jgi:hypothetical protein